ncbi:formate/nitrite transporter family protein [Sphingomonas aerolata]|uniref:formate/nitrite transporter family protein n=1 Tax=Sphingomonas aerolata TaxID=185951 RepID=UPI002FDFBBD1
MFARTLSGKVAVIIGPVAIFVAAGFAHSIANMSLLPIGWSGERLIASRGEVSPREGRTDGHDSARVEVAVAGVVMRLDVIEMHRRGDARICQHPCDVSIQRRIVGDAAHVALEVEVIDRIESGPAW